MPDTPPGVRYALEATLRVGDRTTSWIDVAVVADPTVLVRDGVRLRPQAGAPVEFALLNRGTVGAVHTGSSRRCHSTRRATMNQPRSTRSRGSSSPTPRPTTAEGRDQPDG